MTTNQLFKAIDSTSDKYLNEVLSCEPGGAAAKRRFPIKPLAVCAACLAVIITGAAVIPRLDMDAILSAFDRRSHSGIIRKTTDPQTTHFISAYSDISFGGFSTGDQQNRESLSVSQNTYVSTDVIISLRMGLSEFYDGTSPVGHNIPARLQLLADGEPTEFSLNGSSGMYHDIVLEEAQVNDWNESDKYYYRYPILFSADSSLRQVTAVVTFYPDTVFDYRPVSSGAYLTAGVTARNTAAKTELLTDRKWYKDYYYSGRMIDFECADQLEDRSVKSNWEDPVTYRDGEDLIMEADAPFDFPYELYVMIDGKFIQWCEGKYSTSVYTTTSSDSYTIPGRFIPAGDHHTIQAVAVPILSNKIDVFQIPNLAAVTLIKSEPNLNLEFRDNIGRKAFVNVSAEKVHFGKDEPIKLTATIKNISYDPIVLSCPSPNIGLSVNLTKDGEKLINREGFFNGLNTQSTRLTLEPDEEYVLEMTFEQSVLTADGSIKTAERGKYDGVCTVLVSSLKDADTGCVVEAVMVPIRIELI